MDIYISIPNDFAKAMNEQDIEQALKLNFIIDQYRQGNVGLKDAYHFLDMNELDFLTACNERGVARQTYVDEQELALEFYQLSKNYTPKSVSL